MRLIIVDSTGAAEKYQLGYGYGDGFLARQKLAKLFGDEIVDLSKMHAEGKLDKFVEMMDAKDASKKLFVVDFTSFGHMHNSSDRAILTALKKFNLIVVDEAHIPATGRQAYIVAG